MNSSQTLKIAIQSSGRLRDASLDFFKSYGFDFELTERQLMASPSNGSATFLFLRNEDIPEYVSRGVCDWGIVGENILVEKGVSVKVMKRLDFGVCSLVIAIPEDSPFREVKDLEGSRIATSYPRTLRAYLKSKGISAAIIPLRGSVEIAPRLNLADAICDLTQTGTTLRENGLVPWVKLFDSQAVLIESSPFRQNFIFS